MRNGEIILFSLLGLALLGILAFSLAPGARQDFSYSPEQYAQAKAAELPNDKCATPPGYTDAKWKEHMGHHPDQYRECL